MVTHSGAGFVKQTLFLLLPQAYSTQGCYYLLQRFQVLWVDSVHEIRLRADIVVAFVFDKAHARIVRRLCNRE